jgi:tRNA modification GTPase
MANTLYDTITAIATPPGIGGVGIIRVSGPDAYAIALKVSQKDTLTPRYAHFSKLYDAQQSLVDEGCVIYFKGPNSYTGEDCVEIQTHASPFILKTLLSACVELGARLATGGEFTKRAFINGKLSLSQAESVIDLIHSSSEKSHAVALNHLQGTLFNQLAQYRHDLLTLLENIEASIDFPDEVDPINRDETNTFITTMLTTITSIIELQDYGKVVHSGVNCVIVGKPNVGKSSLFNAFLGDERAIVTDIEGTTRDYIEASIELGGIRFNLFDTAGVRESEDYIEHLGVQKIQELLTKADLVFWVIDTTRPLTENDHKVFEHIQDKSNVILLFNKTDLEPTHPDLPEKAQSLQHFDISAQDPKSLDAVKTYLKTTFVDHFENADLDMICNIRQVDALKRCKTFLESFKNSLSEQIVDDMLSVDLRKIIETLGEVTGDDLTEEMLDNIFSRFCIGK